MQMLRIAILIWLLALPCLGLAHPHAWIDLRVQVLFDDNGQVTALEQSWDLDAMYSLVVLEQIQEEGVGDSLEEKIENFSREMIRQASEYDYMTQLRSGGEPVAAGAVRDHDLEQVDGRLRLSFVLPLVEPMDPAAHALSYAVFDPTFYIEITHDAVELRGASADCRYDIRQPEPTDEMRERALMIDEEDTVDENLGQHFAERTEIRCASSS